MKSLIIILLAVSITACTTTSNSTKKITILSENVGKKITTIYNYYGKNEYKKALNLANKLAPKTAYDRAYVLRVIGMIHLAKGESTEAIYYLKTAVDLNLLGSTDQKHALKTLGNTYLTNGNTEQGQIYLKKAAEFQVPPNNRHEKLEN